MVNDKYVVKYLDPRTGKYEYATIKDVGDLQKLNTKVKTSIVDAINSISTDGIDGIDGLRNDLDTIGKTIKSLEDGTLELGDFQSIDDVVSREIEDAINSLKDENSGLLKLTQEEIDKIVSDAESEYRDSIAASVRELETSKSDLEDAREKMTSIGQMLENADINYSSLTQVVDDINLYITDVIEKTDFDMVNGIVSDYKTAVTQSKDGWGVDASKNMLSYLTGRVKNNETSLDVQHGLIQAKVGKDEFQYMTVDNLPAGKENMLHNTSDLRDWDFSSAFIFKSADDYRFTSIVQSDSAGENIIGTTDELEQGVTYAISAYVNVQNKNKKPNEEKYDSTDGNYTATVIIDGDTIELNNVVEDNSALDGWKRVSGTFIAKRTAKQDIKFYVTSFNRDTQVGYLSAPKLEKGSSATSWIPHIEDNVSTILSQNAVMRVLSDRITSSVEEVRETKGAFETATSTFDQMADGFELNTNKLSEVLDKYGEVTGVQTQQASQLEVLNESITSKVWKQDINTTLDTINIDTSNRIVNSAFNIYSYDEQTGELQLDYWDNNTGFAIKKHSQSLDNYLYAKRSNATSVNPISIKSSPFALRDGEKILFNFEYLAVGNPLDNDNVITLEMYDNDDVRVGLQEFKLSELKKEFLTAYDVGDSYKYNGSYIVKNSSVVKGTITLKLPKNGELWLTKIMLQNAGIGTIGWTPSSIDNQIIQSKLSTEINQLADSIELVAKDERLDAISGLLVKKDGKITISPEAIVSRVTSQELGDKGLVTQTSIKQTEESLRFDLVDKDGIIQTINASADGLLIDFDKVQIDGELIARMISAQSIDATQGFRLTDNNGNTLLSVVNDDGKPILSIARDFNVKFRDFSNKLDVTVVNVVDEYYHSTDENKPVGGQWTSAPNDFRGDTFVWKRTKVVLQSGKKHYLPDKNGINITSGWNYAKGEVTNAIEAAQEEADKAVQSAKDADTRAGTALEKAGTNANLLSTHQNTLNTIKNTTIPNVNKVAKDAMAEAKSALSSAGSAMSEAKTALSSASSAMDEAKKADGKIADYVTKKGLVNGTTVDTKINDATGEISKKITTVESKIPTEIGGRNLILNSNNIPINGSDNGNRDLMTPKGNLFSITTKNAGNVYSSQFIPSETLVKGETYTLSFDVATKSQIGVYWYAVSGGGIRSGGVIPNTNGKIIRYSFTYEQKRDDFKGGFLGGFHDLKAGEEIVFGKFKLERGKIPTDWTPAPEDNYTQEEFKIFESTYDEDVKGINSTLTELSNKKLDGSTYTTFYDNEYKKTAQGVTDTYAKVNKIIDANGNSTDAFAKAVYDRNATRQSASFNKVTKDLVKTATYTAGINGINNSISSVRGDLDNLSVGGRNLVKGTSDEFKSVVFSSWNYYVEKNIPVKGETYYTLSARVIKEYNNQGLLIFEYNDKGVLTEHYKIDLWSQPIHSDDKHSLTIKTKPDTVGVHVGFRNNVTDTNRFKYREFQFEQGNVATDWSPAPEDMLGQADFTVFKGTYESNDQAIKSRLTAIDSGKEGSVIYNTNEALSTAKGNKNTITTLSTKVDGLKIGGQNLISGTDDLTGMFGSGYGGSSIKYHKGYKVTSTEWGKETKATRVVITNANGTSGVFTTTNHFKMIFGKPYTVSFYVKNLGKNRIQFNLNGLMLNPDGTGGQSISVNGGESGKFSATGYMRNKSDWNWFQILPTPDGATSMDFAIAYLQVEEGNFATDWTPALADQMGKSEFTLFKNDYDETAKEVKRVLTAIDSTKEGTVAYNANTALSTAKGNKQNITTLNTKVDGLKIGVQNLVPNSEERIWNWADQLFTASEASKVFKPNTKYAYRWELEITSKISVANKYHLDHRIGGYVFSGGENEDIRQWYMNSKVGDTKLIQGSFTTNSTVNSPFYVYGIRNNNTNTNTNIKVKRILVAESDVLISDWTPSLADQMGKAEFTLFKNDYDKTAKGILSRLTAIDSSADGSVVTRLNKTESTASGNKKTISNIKTKPGEQITGYQTILERSNLYERVIGKDENGVKGNISRIVQTSGVIQSEVASAVPNPNLLSGTDFTEGLGDVREYNREPTLSEASYFPYGKVATINTPETSGTANLGFSVRIPKKDTWYTLSFYGLTNWVGSSGVDFYSQYIKYKKNYKAPMLTGSPLRHKIQVTVQVSQDNAPLYVRPQGNAFGGYSNIVFYGVKLELGEVATPWENSDPASSSKITQLADNINLKVSNKDLLSEINVQAKGVLIQSGTNKLNVTPTTTYIQNGTIKSAMIESLSADKIKTGSLDANLITSGIASKTGNRVTITNTGMKVSDSKFETEFINGGPSFFTKTSTGRAFIGEIGDMTSVIDGSKALGIKGAYGVPIILGVQMSRTDTAYTSKLVVNPLGAAVLGELAVEGDILFTQNGKQALRNIINVDKIFFQGKSYITSTTIIGANGSTMPDTSGWINLQAQWGVNLWYQNQKKARMYGDKFQFWCNIEPQSGFSVSGSSDVRLKHNIVDVKESSLEKLEKIKFKNFTWNSNNKDDFGFIAQEVINIIPEIIEESDDGYYRYNSTRFNMIVAHATKELNDKVKFLENKIERLERIIDGN